jgi:hypothetical protein
MISPTLETEQRQRAKIRGLYYLTIVLFGKDVHDQARDLGFNLGREEFVSFQANGQLLKHHGEHVAVVGRRHLEEILNYHRQAPLKIGSNSCTSNKTKANIIEDTSSVSRPDQQIDSSTAITSQSLATPKSESLAYVICGVQLRVRESIGMMKKHGNHVPGHREKPYSELAAEARTTAGLSTPMPSTVAVKHARTTSGGRTFARRLDTHRHRP